MKELWKELIKPWSMTHLKAHRASPAMLPVHPLIEPMVPVWHPTHPETVPESVPLKSLQCGEVIIGLKN